MRPGRRSKHHRSSSGVRIISEHSIRIMTTWEKKAGAYCERPQMALYQSICSSLRFFLGRLLSAVRCMSVPSIIEFFLSFATACCSSLHKRADRKSLQEFYSNISRTVTFGRICQIDIHSFRTSMRASNNIGSGGRGRGDNAAPNQPM